MFPKNKTGQIAYWILFSIFAIGSAIVRSHDFGKYPADIFCDESSAAIEATELMENGTDHIFYPIIFITTYGIYWIFSKREFWGMAISAAYGVYFAFFCYRYYYSDTRMAINQAFDRELEKSLQRAFEIPGGLCISVVQYQFNFQIAEFNTMYLLRLPYRYYSGQMTTEELTVRKVQVTLESRLIND